MRETALNVFRLAYQGKTRRIAWCTSFSLGVVVCQSVTPLVGKCIFDRGLPAHNYSLIFGLGLVWISLLAAVSALDYLYRIRVTALEVEAVKKLKIAILRAILLRVQEGAGALDKPGGLLSRVIVDPQEFIANSGIDYVIATAKAAITFLVVTAVTFLLDWPLASVCLAGAIVSVGSQYRTPRRLEQSSQKVAAVRAYATQVVENVLAAWRTIVRHDKIEPEIRYADQTLSRLAEAERYAKNKTHRARLQNTVLVSVMPIVLIWVGAFRMASGEMGIGTLIAFVSYLYLANESLSVFFMTGLNIFSGLGQAKEFIRILGEGSRADAPAPPVEPARVLETIVIKNLTLTAGQLVLKADRLCLSRGMTYLLTGRSGVGKSTFLEFLAGLRRVDQAEIYVNQDRCNGERFLRMARNFGYLMKEEVLLDRSVAENLYDLPAQDGRDVEKYVQTLNMDYFARDSIAGLSAGEKQRVSFLRELVRTPQLFIIDEGIDSLDEGLKMRVLGLIREVLPQCILILCTHNWRDDMPIDGRILVAEGRIHQESTSHPRYALATGGAA